MGKRNFAQSPAMHAARSMMSSVGQTLGGETVIQIPLDEIRPSPFNEGLPMDDISRLAESMQEIGLEHPLLVYRRGTASYELVSGHRRLLAARQLRDTDPEKWRTIACIVRDYPEDIHQRFREHADANAQSRDRNTMYWIAETGHAFEILKAEHPEKKKGELVQDVCGLLGNAVSPAQVYRYRGLAEKATPALLSLDRFHLSALVLYSAVNLPEDAQNRIAEAVVEQAEEAPDSDLRGAFLKMVYQERDGAQAGGSDTEESTGPDTPQEGQSEPAPRRRGRKPATYGDKLTKLAGGFLAGLGKAKTEEDRAAARSVIAALREKLDEAEDALECE